MQATRTRGPAERPSLTSALRADGAAAALPRRTVIDLRHPAQPPPVRKGAAPAPPPPPDPAPVSLEPLGPRSSAVEARRLVPSLNLLALPVSYSGRLWRPMSGE